MLGRIRLATQFTARKCSSVKEMQIENLRKSEVNQREELWSPIYYSNVSVGPPITRSTARKYRDMLVALVGG